MNNQPQLVPPLRKRWKTFAYEDSSYIYSRVILKQCLPTLGGIPMPVW